MRALDYIKARQRLWAARKGIRVGSSNRLSTHADERARGEAVWTFDLDDNLFEPLSDDARREFERGDGGELYRDRPGHGNMYALHSSSAAACNFFHFWRSSSDPGPMARACGVPSGSIESIVFEAQHPIADGFDRAPNLDVELRYGSKRLHATAIECKFCEPYGGRRHGGISRKYLERRDLWGTLPDLKELASSISPDDKTFEHLHAGQIIKHVLGLRTRYGADRFRLLYLWYDVPGAEGALHRTEIDRFARVAASDRVHFQATTYQEVVVALGRLTRDRHPSYVDYLAERYL